MATLTDAQLADLREKALAATPTGLGWETENCSIFASDIVQWGKRPGDGSTSDGYLGGVKAQRSSNAFVTVCACWTDEDAAFIAAADPQTVLALIERLREAEAQIGEEVTPKPEPEQPTVSCDDLTSDDIQAAHYDQLKPWPHTRFQGRDVLRGPEPEVTG